MLKTEQDIWLCCSQTGGCPLCLSLVSGHKMCSRDIQALPSCAGAASTAVWKNWPVRKLMSAANSMMRTTESQSTLLALLKDACR